MNFFVCTVRSGCLFSFAFLPQLHHFYLFVVGYVLAYRMTILFHRFTHTFFFVFHRFCLYWKRMEYDWLRHVAKHRFYMFWTHWTKGFWFLSHWKKKLDAEKNQPKRILYCYCLWLLPQFIKWQFRIHSMSDCNANAFSSGCCSMCFTRTFFYNSCTKLFYMTFVCLSNFIDFVWFCWPSMEVNRSMHRCKIHANFKLIKTPSEIISHF